MRKKELTYIVEFEGPDDPLNPLNWPLAKRISATILLSMTTFVVTFASSVFSSGLRAVAAEFNISTEVATLGTSLFVLGFAVGPLVLSPPSFLSFLPKTGANDLDLGSVVRVIWSEMAAITLLRLFRHLSNPRRSSPKRPNNHDLSLLRRRLRLIPARNRRRLDGRHVDSHIPIRCHRRFRPRHIRRSRHGSHHRWIRH